MRRIERGEGRIGCIFWSLLGLIFVLVAVKVVPIKIATLKLEDHMKELALSPRARVAGKDFFEREIFNKAERLKLDIPRKQIRAKKYPERVVMDVEFTVPIDVLSFTYDWDIKIHVDRDVYWI
jgi:hypothetical protein